MKVKDVIELACIFLNKQDLLETDLFSSASPQPSEEQKREINLLVRCLNLVVGEICCDYIPLVEVEEIYVNDGKFDLSLLSKVAMEILQIKNAQGDKIRSKIFPSFVELKNGKYFVEYSFVPNALNFDDDMQDFYGRVADRVFAYGIAMEYCLLSSLFDEMEIWQTRFRDGLRIACQKHAEKKLPRRGWF